MNKLEKLYELQIETENGISFTEEWECFINYFWLKYRQNELENFTFMYLYQITKSYNLIF